MKTNKGEVKQREEVKEKANHLREKRWGMFERSLILPTDLIADRTRADFENGVLTITIPKAEETKPKTITIKAKNK